MAEMVELRLGETNLTARHRRPLEGIDSSLRQLRCQREGQGLCRVLCKNEGESSLYPIPCLRCL